MPQSVGKWVLLAGWRIAGNARPRSQRIAKPNGDVSKTMDGDWASVPRVSVKGCRKRAMFFRFPVPAGFLSGPTSAAPRPTRSRFWRGDRRTCSSKSSREADRERPTGTRQRVKSGFQVVRVAQSRFGAVRRYGQGSLTDLRGRMSGHRRITDIAPKGAEGRFMTHCRHWRGFLAGLPIARDVD